MKADKQTNATERTTSKGQSTRSSGRGNDAHVAEALRNAYEKDVREDVPQEFLDLLGKLS